MQFGHLSGHGDKRETKFSQPFVITDLNLKLLFQLLILTLKFHNLLLKKMDSLIFALANFLYFLFDFIDLN